jgi:PAS domain S-box-containing protein
MSKAKILVVEDENAIALDARRHLESFGYKVLGIARTGEEAIQKAEETEPDLVLIDTALPNEVDGREVAERMRSILDIPVIYLIAQEEEEALRRSAGVSPFGYVLKPFDHKELCSTVEMALYRHRMERKLRESEKMYRNVVERANDGIAIVQNRQFKYVNPRLAEIVGCTVEDLIASPVGKYVHPDDREKVVDRYERRMAGMEAKSIYEAKLRRPDGNVVHVEINAGITTYQGEPADLAVVRDVTERKQVEAALKEHTHQLEALQDISLAITAQLDLEELLHDVVERGCRLLGVKGGSLHLVDDQRGDLVQTVSYGYERDHTGEHLAPGEGTAGTVLETGEPLAVEDYKHWERRSPRWQDEDLTASLSVPLKRADQVIGTLGFDAVAQSRSFEESDIWLATLFANQAAIAIENARLYEEVMQRLGETQALREVTSAAGSTLNFDQMLTRTLQAIHQALDVQSLSFALPDDSGKSLVVHPSCIGFASFSEKSLHLPIAGSLAGQVYASGEPAVAKSTDQMSYRFESEYPETETQLAVPVKVSGKVVGVLSAKGSDADAPDEDDVRVFEAIATQLATAMENARLYEESRARLRSTNSLLEISRDVVSTLDLDKVLRRVIETAIKAIDPADKGTLHLLDEEEGELVVRASVGFSPETVEAARFAPGEGYAGWVFANQQPIIIGNVKTDPRTKPIGLPEVEEEKSALCVPLVFGGKAIGTLTLDNVSRFDAFSKAHLDLLTIFASQAAAAIRNARLHEETQRRASRLASVNRVARAASTSLRLDDLIEAAYQEIDATFEADAFFIALYDEQTEELDFRLSVDEGVRAAPWRRALEPGLTASVVTTGKPLLIGDFEQERERLPPAETWGTEKISHSWLGVPMRTGERVTGVISVQAYRPFAYGEEEQQLLSTIADQVAGAVEQARLHEEARRRATQASLISEVGRHVSGELEPDVLLSTIVSTIHEAFDYHSVILFLLDGEAERLTMQSIAGAYVDILPDDLSLALGEGMIGYAAANGETQLSNDVSTDPHYVRKATEDTRSELAVPVKSGDRVIGVLDLQEDELDAFDELDVVTGETLSTQIGTAIENARLFQAERKRSAQLAAVSRVAESITSTLELDEVLERTVELISKAFGYYYTAIMLVDEDTSELFFGACAGGASGKIPFGFRQGLGEGMIGQAASSGDTVLANDVSQESHYFPAFLTETKSELDVPLKYRGEVIGVLDLQSRQLGAFDEHDVMAMEALAGHVAAAIENARLFEVANQRVVELRAIRQASLELTSTLELEPVLEAILDSALGMVSGDDAHVFLYDGEKLEFGAALWNDKQQGEPYSEPRPHGLTYTVAQQGERIVVPDVTGHPLFEDTGWNGAIVGLPLTMGGEVQGVMNVAFQRPHRFTDDELWVLELLADQAAIAIRNARLYDEARDRALEQETLREAALALTTALDRDEVVTRVLAQLQRVVPYDTASVQLLRDGQLEIVGGRGFPNLDSLLGITFDPTKEDNPNREVVRSRSPVVVEDASRVYEEFRRDPHAPANIRSWLGVPMLVGDRFIGMIALDKREPGFYTSKHARLAEAFAAQAAVAVENAQLHHETVQQLTRTEVLRETMSAAASTLDFEQVLDRTIDILGRAMDCEYLGFLLPDENGAFMKSYPNMLGFDPPEGGYRFPVDQCVTGLVYRTGEPVILPDVREADLYAIAGEAARSELAVPVKIGDEVVAVLNLESSRLDAFDEEDLAFYTAIAGQLGMAMENAQLFEAERKQRQLSEALEEAAAAVSSTLNLEQVLDRILEQVERVVSGDTFNIMLIQEGRARIVRWRGYGKLGVADEASELALPVSEYPTLRRMSQTGRSIVVPDTAEDDDWVSRKRWDWLRSYVAAPIQLGGTIVGFLNVDSTQPHQFDSDDARRLETFASHAATAIENARLYERLREHAETLEERVTERTAQLRAQYARLEAILDSTVNGIVVTGSDGELVLANPVARDWLTKSLSPEESTLLRETVQRLGEDADENPERVLELTGLDLQLRAARISEPGVKEATAVVAIHDISHLKALDRMKSRFVSNVSHELRTPIATIKLFAHLMRKQPERWREYLEPLAQEADHQADLVEDILEISRVDAGRLEVKPERTDLNELAEAVVANYQTSAQKEGLTLTHRSAEPGLISAVDMNRMMQVLDNLINNAIRYTPAGGTVTVSTERTEARGRDWAIITVTDTGMGIPQSELPHVFDRFFRGERPQMMQISGTGLGLAIVKEIVELHGGRVTVESEVDGGSTFTIWLPLAE